jgi:hypothetical protein
VSIVTPIQPADEQAPGAGFPEASGPLPDTVPPPMFEPQPAVEPFPAPELIAFLRERYNEQRQNALDQRMQFWQREVADANTKQSVVDATEQSAMQATAAGRRLAEQVAAGIPADQPELVETARWEGHAAALLHVLCLLARPYAGHPDYLPEWRPGA